MKRNTILLLSLLFIVSCSKTEPERRLTPDSNDGNFVSEQLVNNYLQKLVATKTDSNEYSLDVYRDSEQDTLMYIVNYGSDDGWQVLSSDIRTPAVLAESKSGRFSLEGGSEGFRMWMASMARDIKAVRQSRDEELTFTKEQIEANKSFWGRPPMRKPLPPEEDNPIPQWYTFTYPITEVVDSVGHITVTQWDQNYPYNNKCPFRTDVPSYHAPAGCTVIVGAQMLYFLHSQYGAPETMYTDAEHVGNVDSHYFTCSNPSSTIWSSMTTTYRSYGSVPEASMIAYIGELVSANYQNNGTSASLDSLRLNVFNAMGYGCSYGTYSESAVKSSLLDGCPIVLQAQDESGDHFHAFIIDGYLRTRIHYITEHYCRYPDGSAVPGYPDYTTHSYSDPAITAIKMNWGWWTQWQTGYHYNDGWFALTGGWTVILNNNNVTYEYNRKMMYDFYLANN